MRNIEQSMHKPFAIPTQINNLGVLILAYVIFSVNQQTGCTDPGHTDFLYFILYGSLVVYGFTLILSVLYYFGVIDSCISRLTICGEVCITVQALGIFIFGLIYHFVAMCYGVYQLVFVGESKCIELEIFRRVNGLIYSVWLVMTIFYGVCIYCSRVRIPETTHLLDV
jgi:hypothetical protein